MVNFKPDNSESPSEFIQSLIDQVQFNCDVSDARYWGFFSMCGLLMSLRVLYLSVNDMSPWSSIDREAVSKWIAQKETRWEELEDENFKELTIHNKTYDPFDVTTINNVLKDEGLVYGAGYGLFKKPSFFLADLHSYREVQGCLVYLAKREYVRDLFTSPGMLQGRQVFLRLDPLKSLLWDKYLESQSKNNPGLEYAFSRSGFISGQQINEDFEKRFDDFILKYSDMILHHEIGEVEEGTPEWPEMMLKADSKDTEFFLRAVEDLISDTSDFGPLKSCIDRKDIGDLSLCVALIDRYRVKMYPELKEALDSFKQKENWALMDTARRAVYGRLTSLRDDIIKAYKGSRDTIEFLAKVKEIRSLVVG